MPNTQTQNLFFHNRHDRESRELLNNLPENTQVIDVYGGDEIPDGYHISKLPYLIDKSLALLTPGPFEPGTFILRWQCDGDGLPGDGLPGETPENNTQFFITINGETQDSKLENGLLEIEIECLFPAILDIEILNEVDGYHPWRGIVEAVEAEEAGENDA